MRRDFSESARQELHRLVGEVEGEKWCDVTDWIGDRWQDFQGWLGNLNINQYLDNVSEYHKKVIDKNNATTGDIDAIFEAVNTQSTNYRGRFLAQLTDLRLLKQTIQTLSDTVSPGKGNFTAENINSNLKKKVNGYLNSSKVLLQIAGDGLTSEKLDEITDETQMQSVLDAMAGTLLDLVPSVSAGEKLEIPIGPDLTFYYEVEASADLGGDVDINLVLEDQRAEFGSFSAKIAKIGKDGEIELEISEDGAGISVGNGNSNASVNFDFAEGMVEESGSITIGNNTYTITVGRGLGKTVFEESIETAVGEGSVTTTIGLEKKDGGNNWAPIPAYAPVEVPYPGKVPQIDWDAAWEEAKPVVITAVVIYGVVYIGAAIYSGGSSMAVLPPPVPA